MTRIITLTDTDEALLRFFLNDLMERYANAGCNDFQYTDLVTHCMTREQYETIVKNFNDNDPDGYGGTLDHNQLAALSERLGISVY